MRLAPCVLAVLSACACRGAGRDESRAVAVEPAPKRPAPTRIGPPLPEIQAARSWLLPSSDVTFDPAPRVPAATNEYSLPGCVTAIWTVDGPSASPSRAVGPSVSVTFSAPGDYTIVATCDGERRASSVSLCDFAARLGEAVSYYGDSIEWARVTLEYDAIGAYGASWVAHDHVTIGSGWIESTGACPPSDHYVHELGHVWEHHHGQMQLMRGAMDQIANLFHDAYDFGGPDGVRAAVAEGRPLESFNLEQQAEIFAQDYLMKRRGASHQYARDLAALTAPALRPPGGGVRDVTAAPRP